MGQCCEAMTKERSEAVFTALMEQFQQTKPHRTNNTKYIAAQPGTAARAEQSIPGQVIIFSGCKDSQTSADVSDVVSFGLPTVSDSCKAGGACTNGLLSVLKTNPNISFGNLLVKMQELLKARRYQQIPQLSSSRQIDLATTPFHVLNLNPSGRTRALLIGINYVGQQGQLNGCINDVRMMERFIISAGFKIGGDNIRILTDDPSYGSGMPTCANIVDAMKWLVAGAESGDSLFIHYSGHGTSVHDANSDEADGKDEAIVPIDYQKGGLIDDDTLYQLLVSPLKAGVSLIGIFDCCHSGTIVDLPFLFNGTDSAVSEFQSGHTPQLGANPNFSFDFAELLTSLANNGKIMQFVKQAIQVHLQKPQ